MSTLSATGAGNILSARPPGTFSYRLHFTRSSGDLVYEMGSTWRGNPMFMLTGTWAGTVIVQSSPGRGGSNSTWTAVPGESYTANDAIVLE